MPSTNPEVLMRAARNYRIRHADEIKEKNRIRRAERRKLFPRKSRRGIPQQRNQYGGKPIEIRISIPEEITEFAERQTFYQSEYQKLDYKLRHEKALEKAARYRNKNRDLMLQRTRDWYHRNIDQCRARTKRPRAKALKKEWEEKNRERLNAQGRERYRNATDKHRYLKARYDRIARQNNCASDGTADAFYRLVRSKKLIPCYYCGRKISGKKAHIDHVIAVSRNGNHASDNLCASCPRCNLKKHSKLPSEISFIDQGLLNL